MFSRKMAARITELEEATEQARSRSAKLEKERNRLQVEIHEVVTELEEVSTDCIHALIWVASPACGA